MDDKLKIFYELYDRRRSIREYSEDPIEEIVLHRLLEILRRAQSAANCQPWHFIVIKSDDPVREEFNSVFYKESFKSAPVVIAALADPSNSWTRKEDNKNYAWVDVTIALTEMIGAATAEGLGACWIAAVDTDKVKSILGYADGLELVGLITLGYPSEELKRINKERKPLRDIVTYGRTSGIEGEACGKAGPRDEKE